MVIDLNLLKFTSNHIIHMKSPIFYILIVMLRHFKTEIYYKIIKNWKNLLLIQRTEELIHLHLNELLSLMI